MIRSTTRLLLATCGLALLWPLFAATHVQAYPEQTIRIIVAFPPGGSSDILIRAIEPSIAQELKQSIVIEYRGGAGGNIGMTAVAQAKPDGYTLGIAPAGALTVNAHLTRNMPFDPVKDIVPITLLAQIPFVLVASENTPVTKLTDAIALARSKPGELAIGHGGNSTAMHLTSALFLQKADIKMNLIAYRGTAPAMVDVLAGHVPFAVLDIPASQQLIREGKLKALGVSTTKRVGFLPDVPTLAEAGVPGFEAVGWFGLVAPVGTPQPILDKLNAVFVKALSTPSIIENMRALGVEPAPSSARDFALFIQSEDVKWGRLITEAGIKNE
jgi:tripartite-type tricarboxylate transporter receptor subunit TctC